MANIHRLLLYCLLALSAVLAPHARAQAHLDKAQLDQIMAPIALYPDALLSQVLMAATYPADVAAAAQWSKSHPELSGDAGARAVDSEAWDPSVKSLAAFPSVLDMMGRQPQWVQSVGDAFLAQPDEVMDAVQRLRRQAQAAGSLKTTEQQKVATEGSGPTTIVQIQPANPQVVYVPTYNPAVVYGVWPYPAYPPAYYPPPPGSVFASAVVAGIGFGIGVAAIDALWGDCNWHTHDVDINVNRFNNINVNNRIDANRTRVDWQHNPANRGNVPYNNAAVRSRFDAQRQAGLSNRAQVRTAPAAANRLAAGPGSSRDAARERAAQSFEGRTGQAIPGHASRADRAAGAAGAGQRPARDGNAGPAQRNAMHRQRRADHADALNRSREINRGSALSHAGSGFSASQQRERGSLAAQRLNTPARSFERPAGGFRGGAGGGHFGHGRR